MRDKVGVWVDHRQAILVYLNGEGVRVDRVTSEVEPRVRLAGGSRSSAPYGPQDVISESQRDRRVKDGLRKYYRAIRDKLDTAGVILVMGPGEAKQELLKEFEATNRAGDVSVEVESADRMTEPQIVARVKEHFGRPAPRGRIEPGQRQRSP